MSETVKTVLIDGGSPVALSDEEARFIYNLLPVGEFHDKRYGRVSITPEKVKQMAENFGKYPSYEVPVKIGHEQGAKSPGKVISAEAKPEGLEITMMVDAETAEAINKKQYRYMSAEYDEDYRDKATGQRVGAVLFGAALVNQPGHPYVAPLVLVDDVKTSHEERTDDAMSELEDLRLQLSDMKVQKEHVEAELKTLREASEKTSKMLSDMEAERKSLMEERERMEAARNEAEVRVYSDNWAFGGVPPAMIDKVKPVCLAKTSRTIRLSDEPGDEMPMLKFFDELFELMPKVNLGQVSKNGHPTKELSEYDKAIELGKAIAATANA